MNIFKIIEIIQEAITYGGCYEIKNLNSGEKYVGETLDFFTRMNTHTFLICTQTDTTLKNRIFFHLITNVEILYVTRKPKSFQKQN